MRASGERWLSAAVAVTAAATACVVWATASGADVRPRDERGAWLVVTTSAPTTAPASAEEDDRVAGRRGSDLVFGAATTTERAALASSFERLETKIAIERNPLVEDLEPELHPRADIESWQRAKQPALTAASALARGEWSSHERDVTVRASDRCPKGARCIPLWGGGREREDDARARFLAWPVAYAIVLIAEPPSEASALVSRLRNGLAPRESSSVAIVLDRGALERRATAPEALRIVESARRAVAMLPEGSEDKERLLDLMGSRGSGDAVATLARMLPDGGVLVVPRLSALASIERFVAEVRACAGDAHVRWAYVPSEVR